MRRRQPATRGIGSGHMIGSGQMIGTAVVVVGTVALCGAVVAAAITSVAMARRVVTPPVEREEDVDVLALGEPNASGTPSTITLSRSPDSETPGRYGLWFDRDTGYARVGDIVSRDQESVTRVLNSVEHGDLAARTRGRIGAWYYLDPAELDLPCEVVMVPTQYGDAPARLIPAKEDTGRWVIQLHGWGSAWPEGLRPVAVFRAAGYTSLLISYRNDGDGPYSPDRKYTLGASEWHDVEAAIRFATDRGASEIVLMGWSMGGAIALQTATRSELRGMIRGIVLDSPAIDWVNTLEYQANMLGLPSAVTRGALALLGVPWGKALTGLAEPINLASLDFVAHADELAVPTLLMHSDDDGFVPATGSKALAAARPELVTYVQFRVARHTKLWNYDPERWNGAIAAWLVAL